MEMGVIELVIYGLLSGVCITIATTIIDKIVIGKAGNSFDSVCVNCNTDN